MAKPVDWIGHVIETELASTIKWCHRNKNAQDGRDIIGSRFDDDGSNFRSALTFMTATLSWQPLVQISQVISCTDPIIIIITDGYTQIKAKLSDGAVEALKREIDDIDLHVKGDLFVIKKATVASTPYGPSDEHIQFEIQEIEYSHHLRKILGQPTPILERPKAGSLLAQITEIRRQQYEAPDDHAEPKLTRANANTAATVTAGAVCPRGQDVTNESHSPQSQQSQMRTSPTALTQHSSGTQRAIATQIPIVRKRKAPTLEEDGFEIKQGNNLARPHGPSFKQPTTKPLPSKRHQPDIDQTGAKLFSLLSNQRSALHPQPPPASLVDLASESSHESQHPSPQGPITVRDISGGVEQKSIEAAEQTHDQTNALSVDEDKPSLCAPPKYSLRRIPLDQRSLLDKQDSWIPSLPGKQLPCPNVPIQLLGQWLDQSSPQNEEPENGKNVNIERDAVEGAMETSESSPESSSDAEIEWAPTPSQKKPQLPPDSTMASGGNATPLAVRLQRPPSSLQASSQARDQLPPDSSMDSTGRSPSVSKQTQAQRQVPTSSSYGSATHSSPVLKQTERSLDNSPSSALNRRHMSVSASSAGSGSHRQPTKPQSRAAQKQQMPDSYRLGTGARPRTSQLDGSEQRSINGSNQTSRPTSAGSIVKGTQLAGGDSTLR